MRKARFILGAVAALGIVGSVFAFKVRNTDTVYTKLNPAATICTVPLPGYTTTNTFTTRPVTTQLRYVTDVPGACTQIVYYSGI